MKDAYQFTEQEVVRKLRDMGIEVKYKPVAIVGFNYLNDPRTSVRTGEEEKDIYETLNSIMIRQKTNAILDFVHGEGKENTPA